MASFVSARDIEAQKALKKQENKITREEILKEARDNFEKERQRRELKRERGDDQWVAGGVSKRLGLEEKKHKKHKKKHKSHKPSKKAGRSPQSDDSLTREDEALWVEKEVPSQPVETSSASAAVRRDDWMTMAVGPSAMSIASLAARRGPEIQQPEKRKDVLFDKPGQHPRELNPFWKDGGGGLPQKNADEGDKVESKGGRGGHAWMLRSYKRALEQAETEGRSLEEVASQRWGSLEKLHSLLRAAGIDPRNPDRHRKHRSPPSSSSSSSSRGKPQHSERSRHERHDPRDRQYDIKERQQTSKFLKPGEAHALTNADSTRGTPVVASSRNWKVEKPKAPTGVPRDVSPQANESSSDEERSEPPQPFETAAAAANSVSEPVSDAALNAIGAKLMKAELMGNTERISQLQDQLKRLQQAKSQQESTRSSKPHTREEQTVVLTKTDRFGRTVPASLPSSSGATRPTHPQRVGTHTKKGKREKYFADDDHYSLQSLIEQERMSTAEETQFAIARLAAKFVPAANADETVDDVLDSAAAVRHNPAKEEAKQKQAAMFESRRMTEVLQECKLCFGNQNFSKHLLIAVGIHVYLAVPYHQSLSQGHCLIVPMEHTLCSLQMDENVWSEVQVFRKGLTRMFSDHDMDAVFFETYSSSKRKAHMYIECVPVPKEDGMLAPMYFKKAILESDEEWAQNKKLIDMKTKGVMNSLPNGLPYFYVNFGMDDGFAHVIENQAKFPHYFGREIVGGIVDAEPRLWLKPPKESFEQQKQKVLTLSEWWRPYDWTQRITK